MYHPKQQWGFRGRALGGGEEGGMVGWGVLLRRERRVQCGAGLTPHNSNQAPWGSRRAGVGHWICNCAWSGSQNYVLLLLQLLSSVQFTVDFTVMDNMACLGWILETQVQSLEMSSCLLLLCLGLKFKFKAWMLFDYLGAPWLSRWTTFSLEPMQLQMQCVAFQVVRKHKRSCWLGLEWFWISLAFKVSCVLLEWSWISYSSFSSKMNVTSATVQYMTGLNIRKHKRAMLRKDKLV